MKLSGLLLMLVCFMVHGSEVADLLLKNGNIITLDEKNPRASALAIRGDRILWVGNDSDSAAFLGANTRTMDMEGATLIPGFIEGHAHLTGIGMAQMILDLRDVTTWDQVIAIVKDAVASAPKGAWISGRGWHQDKWQRIPPGAVEGYPVHADLSAISPDNPVLLRHASGHALFANAAAMKLAEVVDGTPNPEGGKIVRDAAGHATGIFEENGGDLVQAAKGRDDALRSPEERKAQALKAIELAMQECLANGITSFHDAGVPFSTLDLYKDLAAAGELKIRLWVMAGAANEELAVQLPNYQLRDFGNGFLTLGGIKQYMDGALGSRGAWLLKPYADLPGSTGQNVTPLSELAETAKIAKQNKLQLCVHAIGDRGNKEVLDLFEQAHGVEKLRWRIEHAQHLNPQDIPRFAKLGVIASMQGVHCTSDSPFVEKRLGRQRALEGAYVWRKLVDSGAVVTNGTDAPVEKVSALDSYFSMVTRQWDDGTTFYPEHRLTALEALRAYTLDNAYAAFQEKDKGSLEAGKLADITVLSQDITAAPVENIKKAVVRYTIVGGKIAYEAK